MSIDDTIAHLELWDAVDCFERAQHTDYAKRLDCSHVAAAHTRVHLRVHIPGVYCIRVLVRFVCTIFVYECVWSIARNIRGGGVGESEREQRAQYDERVEDVPRVAAIGAGVQEHAEVDELRAP